MDSKSKKDDLSNIRRKKNWQNWQTWFNEVSSRFLHDLYTCDIAQVDSPKFAVFCQLFIHCVMQNLNCYLIDEKRTTCWYLWHFASQSNSYLFKDMMFHNLVHWGALSSVRSFASTIFSSFDKICKGFYLMKGVDTWPMECLDFRSCKMNLKLFWAKLVYQKLHDLDH